MTQPTTNIQIKIRSDINTVLNSYEYDFTAAKITPLGNGHINRTFKVICQPSIYSNAVNAEQEIVFVLQQINHNVFSKTVELISNTQKITQHLIRQKQLGNYSLKAPKQLLTKTGIPYVKVGKDYWRLMEFISSSHTLETLESPNQAGLVASAFAQFSAALSNFPTNELSVIIEDFHCIRFRMGQLKEAVTKNRHNRLTSCQALVNFCFAQQAFIEHVLDISSQLPRHVTHNDTKINNLLFRHGSSNRTDKPCAVIDLDTCMPGLLMHDFGDMVRTCCSSLAEDDPNINKMTFKLDIFSALIKNYQNTLGDKITPLEKESLIVGSKLLPFMVATRFLTDYLNGDSYFQIKHKSHNLDRAANQIQLYKLLCDAEQDLFRLSKT